jgi:predicted PurR-regulated permease PerM
MTLRRYRFFRPAAVVLILSFLVVALVPAKTLAYVVGSQELSGSQAAERDADLDKVQRVLESKMVAKRLETLGLSTEEITQRLDKLSDEELHWFASQVDSLYPGGNGLGLIIAVLVIILLVLVILKVTDKKIIIE